MFVFLRKPFKTNQWKNLRNFLYNMENIQEQFSLLVSGQRTKWTKWTKWTKVRTGENTHGATNKNSIGVFNNKMFYDVHWSKPIDFKSSLTFVHSNLCPSTSPLTNLSVGMFSQVSNILLRACLRTITH